MVDDIKQSVFNIGTLGHIDHGKTSLTRAITHIWTDKHSESIKRDMTIKLGYADATIKRCEQCVGASAYTTADVCEHCNNKPSVLMRISLVDAPGHETLMATAIAGASIIDAVLFVIAANEPCPMPQTKEHLMVINLLGIKNVIIVQTKIDIVGRDKAIAHHNQIREFIRGSSIEAAPIVPVMTNRNINIDQLLEMIAKMPKPKRDVESYPIMYIVRSFDVNKPGANIDKLIGGVIGGSIIRGRFKVGDDIEIRPGINISDNPKKDEYVPTITHIMSMNNGEDQVESAIAGGLTGIATMIDPSFVKADNLVGRVVGHVGKLPETVTSVQIIYKRINRNDIPVQGFSENEALIVGIATATVVGRVKKAKRDTLTLEFNHPVCIDKEAKIAILRNIAKRWRLTGYGLLSTK